MQTETTGKLPITSLTVQRPTGYVYCRGIKIVYIIRITNRLIRPRLNAYSTIAELKSASKTLACLTHPKGYETLVAYGLIGKYGLAVD